MSLAKSTKKKKKTHLRNQFRIEFVPTMGFGASSKRGKNVYNVKVQSVTRVIVYGTKHAFENLECKV